MRWNHEAGHTRHPTEGGILRAALASGDHPTADMIYAAVRRELPRISLGTVYRNLQRLVAEGRMSLAPIQDDSGRSARFDPETSPYDHFVCQGCKRIYDVARDRTRSVDLAALEMQRFRVTSDMLAVYGFCPAVRTAPPRGELTGASRAPAGRSSGPCSLRHDACLRTPSPSARG